MDDPCEECGCSSFIHDPATGETICTECGAVMVVQNVVNSQRRTFSHEEKEERETRTATDTKAFDGGISSMIQYADVRFGTLTLEQQRIFMRLRKWDRRTKLHGSKMRNMSIASDKMRRMINALNLPLKVYTEADYIYRQALAANLVRGRSISDMTAASIYVACRIQKVPRRLNDILEAEKEANKSKFTSCIRLLLKELGIRPGVHQTSPYIAQCVSKLNLPPVVEKRAREMLEILVDAHWTGGRSPAVLAGTLTYLACREENLKVTQISVSKALRITDVSLRNTMNRIKEDGALVLP